MNKDKLSEESFSLVFYLIYVPFFAFVSYNVIFNSDSPAIDKFQYPKRLILLIAKYYYPLILSVFIVLAIKFRGRLRKISTLATILWIIGILLIFTPLYLFIGSGFSDN